MTEIPEDKYCCKYCSYCDCFSEDYHGKAMCNNDIGEYVDVDEGYCCEFDYYPDFNRT